MDPETACGGEVVRCGAVVGGASVDGGDVVEGLDGRAGVAAGDDRKAADGDVVGEEAGGAKLRTCDVGGGEVDGNGGVVVGAGELGEGPDVPAAGTG